MCFCTDVLVDHSQKRHFIKIMPLTNQNKYNIETCSKMKEDIGILIMNNYNIAVNFEYCHLLDTIPAENINIANETE